MIQPIGKDPKNYDSTFVFSFFVFDNLQIIQISNLSNITIYFFNGFIPPG